VFTCANAAIFLAEGITVPMIVGAAPVVGLCRWQNLSPAET
jgi:hypothetical protein